MSTNYSPEEIKALREKNLAAMRELQTKIESLQGEWDFITEQGPGTYAPDHPTGLRLHRARSKLREHEIQAHALRLMLENTADRATETPRPVVTVPLAEEFKALFDKDEDGGMIWTGTELL